MWAITGTGLLNCLGTDPAASFAACCRATSGSRPLQAFDHARYRVRVGYEILDRPDGHRDVPRRASRWLCDVIEQATVRAGLPLGSPRIPVIVGTGLAEQRSVELWWTAGADLVLGELNFAGAVADRFGPVSTTTLVNACSAGLYALAVATDLLDLDEADAVVVAATDSITESMHGLLDRSTPQPHGKIRPFDQLRRGVILGEGAAAVVVEPLTRAAGRGADVLAVLRGVGTSCDAYHVTAPSRAGIRRAIRDACQRGDVQPEQVDLVLAHGTGTPLNDPTEALALQDVFLGAARRPVITSLKSLIGHTAGASGLMSLVTAVDAMDQDRVPPTLHHSGTIDELAGFRVVTATAPARLATVQVNAFGFGGVNAVAMLSRRPAGSPSGHGRRNQSSLVPVVVTGVGLAASGLPTVQALLTADRSAGHRLDPAAILGIRGLRYKDRATLLSLCAVTDALADAGLSMTADRDGGATPCGVIVSSTLAAVETVCHTVSTVHTAGVRATSPMDLPNASANAAASSIAIQFGLTGMNLTVSSGPSSGLTAIYLGASAIRADRADRVAVVGVEPSDPVGERLTRDTALRYGRHPADVRLFDGAAAIILEAYPVAVARGARIRAIVERYAQDRSLAGTVDAACSDGRPADLWLPPCQAHGRVRQLARSRPPDRGLLDRRQLDLSAVTGEAAAALGVLQSAAAATWLTDHPGHRTLLSSGGCWGEGYASLTMRGEE
jgi:3-oxoacyl-[acyl-carrier-protein] synthase II